MTHAHLLQMGGFRLHVTDEDSDMLKNEYCFRQHEKYGINVVEVTSSYLHIRGAISTLSEMPSTIPKGVSGLFLDLLFTL